MRGACPKCRHLWEYHTWQHIAGSVGFEWKCGYYCTCRATPSTQEAEAAREAREGE